MERIDTIAFYPYFAQVAGSAFCVIVLTYAVLSVS